VSGRFRLAVAAAVLGLLVVTANEFSIQQSSGNVALNKVSHQRPGLHWSVVKTTFLSRAVGSPANGMSFSGQSGPMWLVELTAEGDHNWANYRGVVLISALTGQVVGAQATGSN
jgi:hypothetical protein